ncbi:MAG: hypothetical protein ACREVR_08975 [Burkholderiales bacterium]
MNGTIMRIGFDGQACPEPVEAARPEFVEAARPEFVEGSCASAGHATAVSAMASEMAPMLCEVFMVAPLVQVYYVKDA